MAGAERTGILGTVAGLTSAPTGKQSGAGGWGAGDAGAAIGAVTVCRLGNCGKDRPVPHSGQNRNPEASPGDVGI